MVTSGSPNYKGCSCPKCKLKRKPSLSELTIQAEHAQRDYVFLSEGKSCEFNGCKEEAYCLDHVRSRAVRELFFKRTNLFKICKGHHYSKTNGYDGIHLKQEDYIKEKYGDKEYEKNRQKEMNRKPWPKWNRQYVESKKNYYLKKIAQLTK